MRFAFGVTLKKTGVMRHKDAVLATSEDQVVGIASILKPRFMRGGDVDSDLAQPVSDGIRNMLVKMKLDCCHPWRLVLLGASRWR